MPRMRNALTGVVVQVSDEQAESLGKQYEPLDDVQPEPLDDVQPEPESDDVQPEPVKRTTRRKA